MSLKNYSITPATNQSGSVPEFCPEGWALADINGWGAEVMSAVRSLASADTIASATTCDIGSKDATFLTVSGTTTITGLGTVSAGIYKVLYFSGSLTLTHNSTSLILQGAANRKISAGDQGIYVSLGSGNWREVSFHSAKNRINVTPLDFGAMGDVKSVSDGAIDTGVSTTTLNSATAGFTTADVGKYVTVRGAGAAGAILKTTISAYVSATAVTIADAASTTVTGARTVYGTDDTTAVQAAVDRAETYGGVFDGLGRQYGITSRVSIGGSLAIAGQNATLVAVGGTWASDSTGAMLAITAASNFVDSQLGLTGINANCNEVAKSGFYINEVQAKASFIDCHTWYFSEKGFWLDGAAAGDGNTDSRYIGCTAAERLWTADTSDAFHVLANRTAFAWYVDLSADVEFIDCVGYGSLRNLKVVNGPYNGIFSGCKYWSGPTRTSASSVTVEIINGERLQFIGCRFDDGAVKLNTFKNQFVGCQFIQYDAAAQLQLEATAAGETAAGLILVGNQFTGTTPTALSTSGGGSWATNKNWVVSGNTKTDGTPVTLDTWEYQSGVVKYKNGEYVYGDGVNTELFTFNGGAGYNRLFQVQTAGVVRWGWGASSDAESGANAGSNYAFNSYDDSGVYIETPMSITRATGQVVLGDSGGSGTRVKMNTTSGSTVGAAGGASALPATPTGYITVNINGTDRKIPYYAV